MLLQTFTNIWDLKTTQIQKVFEVSAGFFFSTRKKSNKHLLAWIDISNEQSATTTNSMIKQTNQRFRWQKQETNKLFLLCTAMKWLCNILVSYIPCRGCFNTHCRPECVSFKKIWTTCTSKGAFIQINKEKTRNVTHNVQPRHALTRNHEIYS